jgi:hypothetical protein
MSVIPVTQQFVTPYIWKGLNVTGKISNLEATLNKLSLEFTKNHIQWVLGSFP